MTPRQVSALILWVFFVPPFLVALTLLYVRRRRPVISQRVTPETIVVVVSGLVLEVLILVQQFVTMPCPVYTMVSYAHPAFTAFPMLLRMWQVLCRAKIQRATARAMDDLASGRMNERISPWIAHRGVLTGRVPMMALWTCVAALHVLCAVADLVASRDDEHGSCALFFRRLWFFCSLFGLYIAAAIAMMVTLHSVSEDFLYKTEFAVYWSTTALLLGLLLFTRLMGWPTAPVFTLSIWPPVSTSLSLFAPLVRSFLPSRAKRRTPGPPPPGSPGSTVELKTSPSFDAGKTLEETLQDPAQRVRFREYLVSRFAVENLLFWEQVQLYRRQNAPAQRAEVGTRILAMFFDMGLAPERGHEEATTGLGFDGLVPHWALNVSGAMRKMMLALTPENMRDPDVGPHVFDECLQEILSQLKIEHWADYKGLSPQLGLVPQAPVID